MNASAEVIVSDLNKVIVSDINNVIVSDINNINKVELSIPNEGVCKHIKRSLQT